MRLNWNNLGAIFLAFAMAALVYGLALGLQLSFFSVDDWSYIFGLTGDYYYKLSTPFNSFLSLPFSFLIQYLYQTDFTIPWVSVFYLLSGMVVLYYTFITLINSKLPNWSKLLILVATLLFAFQFEGVTWQYTKLSIWAGGLALFYLYFLKKNVSAFILLLICYIWRYQSFEVIVYIGALGVFYWLFSKGKRQFLTFAAFVGLFFIIHQFEISAFEQYQPGYNDWYKSRVKVHDFKRFMNYFESSNPTLNENSFALPDEEMDEFCNECGLDKAKLIINTNFVYNSIPDEFSPQKLSCFLSKVDKWIVLHPVQYLELKFYPPKGNIRALFPLYFRLLFSIMGAILIFTLLMDERNALLRLISKGFLYAGWAFMAWKFHENILWLLPILLLIIFSTRDRLMLQVLVFTCYVGLELISITYFKYMPSRVALVFPLLVLLIYSKDDIRSTGIPELVTTLLSIAIFIFTVAIYYAPTDATNFYKNVDALPTNGTILIEDFNYLGVESIPVNTPPNEIRSHLQGRTYYSYNSFFISKAQITTQKPEQFVLEDELLKNNGYYVHGKQALFEKLLQHSYTQKVGELPNGLQIDRILDKRKIITDTLETAVNQEIQNNANH